MAVAQGGEAEDLLSRAYASLPTRMNVVSMRRDDGGENFFAGKIGEGEIVVDPLADGGERFGEEDHALVLGFVADFAPARMVAALLAAAGVASGGLEVAVGDGADPDIGPCGRDDEGLDAGESFVVAEGFAVGVV